MFYMLSLFSGILECGWIFFAANNMPIWLSVIYPLMYHLGNLFPLPFSMNRRELLVTCICGVFISHSVFVSHKVFGVFTNPPIWLAIFITSAVMQSLRCDMKSGSKTLRKRVMRVCGFALAPITAVSPTTVLVATSAATVYAMTYAKPQKRPAFIRMNSCGGFSAVMIFHQLHYFTYAHIMLLCAAMRIGIPAASTLFCLTWVTYMLTEPILRKLNIPLKPAFFIGHTGISLMLLCMSFVSKTVLIWPLWVMTGFFGGTVFTISDIARTRNIYDKTSMTIAENYGHIGGLVIAFAATAISTYARGIVCIPEVLRLASICAFFAVLLMAAILKGEKNHENC